jgi:hypothetical protein
LERESNIAGAAPGTDTQLQNIIEMKGGGAERSGGNRALWALVDRRVNKTKRGRLFPHSSHIMPEREARGESGGQEGGLGAVFYLHVRNN